MRILVDADACPVKPQILAVAREFGLPVVLFHDTSHVPHPSEEAETILIGQGRDAVDLALVNRAAPGDIVVTQDYGLAALALGKGTLALDQNGRQYTPANIDRLLEERHLSRKIRRAGGRHGGPRPRTAQDDRRFTETLRALCGTAPKDPKERRE